MRYLERLCLVEFVDEIKEWVRLPEKQHVASQAVSFHCNREQTAAVVRERKTSENWGDWSRDFTEMVEDNRRDGETTTQKELYQLLFQRLMENVVTWCNDDQLKLIISRILHTPTWSTRQHRRLIQSGTFVQSFVRIYHQAYKTKPILAIKLNTGE